MHRALDRALDVNRKVNCSQRDARTTTGHHTTRAGMAGLSRSVSAERPGGEDIPATGQAEARGAGS